MKKPANHYYNEKTKMVICKSGKQWSWGYQLRGWTKNKEEVTCKHCLIILEKWKVAQSKC